MVIVGRRFTRGSEGREGRPGERVLGWAGAASAPRTCDSGMAEGGC